MLLETERLRFRRFADTDADPARMLELGSDPEVMRYTGPFGLVTVAEYRERLRTGLRFAVRRGARLGAGRALDRRFDRGAVYYRPSTGS
ncbi:MAG TPA: hypothetical protein VGE74_04775 [Gemmata sp.]